MNAKNKNFIREKRKGQVMLMSVIMMSGILISAAAIGGLLMIFQIRQANDSVNSARAFFAADAAIEAQSYEDIKGGGSGLVFITPGISGEATSSQIGNELIIRSEGFSGTAVRSLEAVFITGP